MIDEAKAFWEESTDIVGLVKGDFFVQVPKADVYILKHILHDWDDNEAVEILKVIHKSAVKV